MRFTSIKLPYIYEFLIAFAIVLIVRGTAIFSVTWAQDDFFQLFDPAGDGFITVHISMLRPSVAFITGLVKWLGATFPTNGSLWSALHAGALVVFGLALRRLWIPEVSSFYGVITALLFALFPGVSNLWQYQVIHPSMTAIYCLGGFALVSYQKGGWRSIASIFAFAFTLSYQVMISLYLVALFILLAIKIISYGKSHAVARDSFGFPVYFYPVLFLALSLFAGLIVYVVSAKLILSFSGLGLSNRVAVAKLNSLPEKSLLLWADMKRLFYGRGQVYLPKNIKLIQSSLFACALASAVFTATTLSRKIMNIAAYLLVAFLVLFAAAISIRIPTIFFAYSVDNPRVFIGTAVFWSGIFALAISSGPRFLRGIVIFLGVLLFAAYAIITNSVCSDFVRLNQRELLLASRMIDRMSQLPGFANIRTVVVVGASKQVTQDLRGVDLIWSGLNSPMATGLLREVSGADLQNPSPADTELANRVSQQMPTWPTPGSTAIVEDIGVVVLGEPV